ncbi:MAG: hypothetical protein H7Z10_16335 [Gemmatimonadaceae bacterium]|nr:hypothetical protein [Acetobacteraceae bacterium]
MIDGSDSLVLQILQRMDEKLDRATADVGALKHGMTSVERQLADIRGDIADLSRRIERVEVRLNSIERRLDLVDSR